MNIDAPPGSRDEIPRPSGLATLLVALAPLIGAALVTSAVGISPLVAVAILVAATASMIIAGTYLISLAVRPDRSPLRARFEILYDTPTPRRLQRWYVPLLTAATVGGGAEILRKLLPLFSEDGVRATVVVAGLVVGVLEGVLLVLAMALSWAIASLLVTRRLRRVSNRGHR